MQEDEEEVESRRGGWSAPDRNLDRLSRLKTNCVIGVCYCVLLCIVIWGSCAMVRTKLKLFSVYFCRPAHFLQINSCFVAL